MYKMTVIVEEISAGDGTKENPHRHVYKFHDELKIPMNQPSCPFLILDRRKGLIIWDGIAYMNKETFGGG